MIRLNHHQYTRISMLEDVLAEFDYRVPSLSLYVDTWRPSTGQEDSIRVSFIDEAAVTAGPGGETFAEFVLNLDVLTDGALQDEDGVLFTRAEEPTIHDVRDYLADHFRQED